MPQPDQTEAVGQSVSCVTGHNAAALGCADANFGMDTAFLDPLLPLLCRIGIVAITSPGMAVAKMNAIGIEKQTVKLVIRVGVKRFAGEQGGQGGGGIRRRIDQDGKLHQSSPLRAVRICSRDMNRL